MEQKLIFDTGKHDIQNDDVEFFPQHVVTLIRILRRVILDLQFLHNSSQHFVKENVEINHIMWLLTEKNDCFILELFIVSLPS